MKYRKPIALAASAAMMASAAIADPVPLTTPELDVTVIEQDLGAESTQLFVPVLALILFLLALNGASNGGMSVNYR